MYVRPLRSLDKKETIFSENETDKSFLTVRPAKYSTSGAFNKNHKLTGFYVVKTDKREDPCLLYFNVKNQKQQVVLFYKMIKEVIFKENTPFKLHFKLSKDELDYLKNVLSKTTVKAECEVNLLEDKYVGFIKFHEFPLFKSKYLRAIAEIYSSNKLSPNIYSFIEGLKRVMDAEEIDSIKDYIFREFNERNLRNLQRIHPEFLVTSISNAKLLINRERFLPEALEEKGFKQKKRDNSIFSNIYNSKKSLHKLDRVYRIYEDKTLEYYKTLTFKSDRYYAESISKYRFFIKKMINHLKTNQNSVKYILMDRDGCPLYEIRKGSHKPVDLVPLYFQKAFNAKVDNLLMLKELTSLFEKYNLTGLRERYDIEYGFWEFFAERLKNYMSKEDVLNLFEEFIADSVRLKVKTKLVSFKIIRKKMLDDIFSSEVLKSIEDKITTMYPLIEKERYVTKGMFLSLYKEDRKAIKNYTYIISFIQDKWSFNKEYVKTNRRKMSYVLKNDLAKFLEFINEELILIYKHHGTLLDDYSKNSLSILLNKLFSGKTANNIYSEMAWFDNSLEKENFFKLLNDCRNIFFANDIDLYDYSRGYLYPTIYEVYEVYGYNTAIEFAKRWSKYLIKHEAERPDKNSLIHDTGYVYSEIIRLKHTLSGYIFSEETLFEFTSLNLKKMNELVREIQAFDFYFKQENVNKEDIIKQVKEAINSGGSVKAILMKLEGQYVETFLNNNPTFSNLNKEVCFEFISRLKKYNPNLSLLSLINEFEEEMTMNILNGSVEGVFTPKNFYMSNEELKQILIRELSNKGATSTIQNPRKLYAHLSKIKNVQELMTGFVSPADLNAVINVFKNLGVQYDPLITSKTLIRGLIEPKCSPEFLVAGDASVCCMSFGANNAHTYAVQKGFGLFNVYYKDRIIANSVLWINKTHNSLVIDNVEVHPNYVKFSKEIKEVYFEMIEQTLIDYNLDFAVQGDSYNDLRLTKGKYVEHDFEGLEIDNNEFYTDAYYVKPIKAGSLEIEEIYKILQEVGVKEEGENSEAVFQQM